jgi:delta 1-pyrroline-5-carboxylate dehydrogenase
MKEEMFGPILMVVEVADMDDAIKVIKRNEKPLALYMFSKNKGKIDKMLSSVQSGGVCVNDVLMHYIPVVLPFGGVGNSGMGNYHGKYGFDAFTHQRSVWIDGTPEALLENRYPPFTQSKINLLKHILWNNPKGFMSNLKSFLFLGLLGVVIAYGLAYLKKNV